MLRKFWGGDRGNAVRYLPPERSDTQPVAEPRQSSMGSAHRAGWFRGEGEFYIPPLASGKPWFFVKNRREAVFPKVDTP